MSLRHNIWDFPFDVLCLIFDKMVYFRNELNFARVHWKLGQVFAYKKRDFLTRLNFNGHKMEDALFIVEVAGSIIRSIRCTNNSSAMLHQAQKYCTQIEYLHFHIRPDDDYFMMANNLSQLTTIQKLEIIFTGNGSDAVKLNGTLIESLKSLPKLNDLKLSNFPDQEVVNVKNLSKLEMLYLNNIQLKTLSMQQCLQEVFSTLSNLRCLKFYDGYLTKPDFREISLIKASQLPSCPRLERRRLKTPMCQLKRLTHLELHDVYISNASLLQVLQECKILMSLKLYETKLINNEFVLKSLNILSGNQYVNAGGPFHLFAQNTGITENVHNKLIKNENIHLMDLIVCNY